MSQAATHIKPASTPHAGSGAKCSLSIKRVLFVIPGDLVGHSMIFARRQAGILANEGIEVSSFYLATRTSFFRLVQEALRLRRMLKQEKPEVIHAHYGTVTALFAALAAPQLPLVITFRGGDLNPAGPRTRLATRIRSLAARLMSQLAALFASRIICVSSQLRSRLWWRHSLAEVLPSGTDIQKFLPMNQSGARARLNWQADDRVILFNAGRDAQNKRLDLAQEAFAILCQRIDRVKLMVLDGTTDPDAMPLLMNAASCLLMTSDQEGSPTVIQEAMACNLPVVSVDVGDTVERLDGVSNSRIVAHEAGAISSALESVLATEERSNGALKVNEFCSEHVARALARTYCTAKRNDIRARRKKKTSRN